MTSEVYNRLNSAQIYMKYFESH